MDFKKVKDQLKKQGRKKGWLIDQLKSYPMEYRRVEEGHKELPLGWKERISGILNIPCTFLD